MAYHVDIVRNDWSRGEQKRVAHVVIGLDVLEVFQDDQGEPPTWLPLIREKVADVVHRGGAPDLAYKQLHELIDSSVLVVSEPHNEEECIFDTDNVVKMQALPVDAFQVPHGVE